MTLQQLPLIMLRALALTVIMECAAAWCLGVRDRHDQLVVVLVNLMTNPLVVSCGAAAAVWIGYGALLPVTLLLEAAAVLAEGIAYRRYIKTDIDPFMLSVICNASSYLIGELLNRFVL